MNIRNFNNQRIVLLLACLLLTPLYVFGQDLGSTSGLFRNNTTTKKSTPSKSTKKKKSNTSKSKATKQTPTPRTKKNTARRSTTRKKSNSGKSNSSTTTNNSTQTSSNKSNVRKPNNGIIINVGDSTTGNFEELFEKAIIEGNTARNLREYIKAEDAYSRAKSIDSEDSRAIYGLGNIYSDQQRWEEAEKAYRQAIRIDSDNPSAYIAISYVLTQPVVGSNLGKRYEEAEKMARRAIGLDPNNAIGFDQLGVALELRGFIGDETQNAYRNAIKLSPEFALAYAHLGRLLRRNGLTKESSAAYGKAKLLSKDVPTMILVADVMQSQQRYEDSEILLRAALKQDPKNPTGLYLLGRALTTRKSFKEAEAVLRKSVEVSPNSFVSYSLLGSMYYSSGDLIKAEKTLNQALNVISNNEKKRLAQEFEEVGDRHLKAGNNLDALRLFESARKLDPTRASLKIKINQTKNN